MNLTVNGLNTNNNFHMKNVVFSGLKQNMRIGEKALKSFKSEFPYLKSDTFVMMKMEQHKFAKTAQNLIKKLEILRQSYTFRIGHTMYCLDNARFLKKDENEALKKILKNFPYARCGEQTSLLWSKFFKKGEKPVRALMKISKDKSGDFVCNHAFLILGMKKNAKLDSVKDWGNSAVVVDPWLNFVMPKNDAVEFYKKNFCFNVKKEHMDFTWIPTF